jgi:hypothetical protein
MTSSSVSVQGLTYQITCVSLENCLTSGVHLTPTRHARATPKGRIAEVLCLQQALKNRGRGAESGSESKFHERLTQMDAEQEQK